MSTRPLPRLLLLGLGLGTSLMFSAADAQPVGKPRRMTVAYFGDNVVNPGASVGYEAAFYQRRNHELFGGAHIGGYNSAEPPHYGLLIYIEGGYRLNFSVGFFLEARFGLGYVNVNKASTIEVDGAVAPGPNVSINYLAPLGLGGLGYDFLRKTRVPISLFADVGGMGRYTQAEPFSGGLIFTTGLAYQFGTGRPRPADTAVGPTPFPVAPTNLDTGAPPPGPIAPPDPNAPNVPPGPNAPGPAEPMPPPGPEPPQLPPPPTVPGS
jgi:hypothetical protein